MRSIYLSANLDPVTRAQVEPLQPLGYVGKPFLPADILSAVEAAVEKLSSATC